MKMSWDETKKALEIRIDVIDELLNDACLEAPEFWKGHINGIKVALSYF